ncbi:LysM peptidoglycan-binding domain-containing protein [Streptomyces harbinensis]|uniref:BTAD domain-containing putative transcriptional regulator n=1 Tax=Streptomyces harbinensis TaxID=1176198 RepID=UPI0015917575|nr:BTAD domain-containing putative transcriptional regulator [Streptomyces harbinensis]QKV69224.1 LysM peptidoglycan-binding domain-containing protein [Streptomyces harbinensis]
MARTTPTGGGNRTPVPVKVGRSFGDIMKALFAFVALAALVVGVPFSLAVLIGWPLPRTMPSLDTLQNEISTTVFLKVLALCVWIAWAQFTACVLVEVKAALSGVGIPARVPGAGPSQLLARQLVGMLLLVTASAASFVPGISGIGGAFDGGGSSQVVAEAERTPGGEAEHAYESDGVNRADPTMALPNEAPGADEAAEAPTKYYRIQPPEGRHHDTLWGIAERHLDDGLRYKEIYQLNKDRVQPDGSKLTEASLIRPGWILEMPADAHGGELVEMPHDVEELSQDEVEEFQDYQRTGDTEWADPDDSGVDRADLRVPELGLVPEEPGGGHSLPAFDTTPIQEAEEAADEAGFGLPEALLGAPLLAAGLLMALGRTRRNALWASAAGTLAGRGVGDDLAPTSPAAHDVRDALLVGAAPEAVGFLDQALRRLSAALDAEGKVLPPVYAAWLTEHELHLQLAAPAGRPPAPWEPGQSDTYWTVRRDRLPAAAAAGEAPEAEAPYPGLVSLGVRDDMRLLLNLEAVPGIVSVTGARADREAVLASIAAELATSGWADRMTVSLVGFGGELTALAPTRVRYLDDVAGLLEVMETETQLRRGALRHTGQESILTGRTGPARQQQWAPHLVLIGAVPTAEQADRLAALAAVSAQLGIGYLVTSDRPDLPGIAWEFEISDAGVLTEPEMGLELSAQLLPAAQRAAVVELFAELTREPSGGAAGVPGPAFTVDLSQRGKPDVYAQVMGGYEVSGLDAPDAERGEQLREALALLLLHREGVHPRVLGSALWPRGVPDDVRDALIARLRDWLGADAAGAPRLLVAEDGRLSLSAGVVSDWDVLRTLHHRAVSVGGGTAAERKRQLTDALSLARGPLLAGVREGGRFGWLEHEIVDAQYPLLVSEIALKLSAEQLASGGSEQAYVAIRSALAASPTDERLWNELLRSAKATGKAEWLRGAADWLIAHHAHLYGPAQALPAQTEALLDELLPGWRSTVGAAG